MIESRSLFSLEADRRQLGDPSAFAGLRAGEVLYPAVCHDGSTEGSVFSLAMGLPLPEE